MIETIIAGLLMEYPLLNVHIRNFSTEHKLNACHFDLAVCCPPGALAPKFKRNTSKKTIVAKMNKK